MIKIIPPNAWNLDGPQVESIKIASYGLRGNDFADFVKRAGHPLASWVREHRPLPGELYVHAIALGSTEKYGSNRNHDGYPRSMLERDHPTFEKYARFYRLHKNKDQSKSYGVIKKSWYNPELERVETIVALNGNKEAADRNGGFIADKELDTLNSGRDLAVSQSVKVAYDECTSCGNKAKHRGEYCGPKMCKYGGCRDNLGRVFDDGFHLFVQNPKGTFFDLSNVSGDLGSRGADRTAFVTGKVAESNTQKGGAELAELMGLVPPEYLLEQKPLAALRCLRKLAECKDYSYPGAPTWDDCVKVRSQLSNKTLEFPVFPSDDAGRHEKLAELASCGVILPPSQWISVFTGISKEKCGMVLTNLNVVNDAITRNDLHDILSEATMTVEPNNMNQKWAWLAPSTKAHAVESQLGILKPATKYASVQTPPEVRNELAARYLAYQAGVLASFENSPKFPLLLNECIRHNQCNTW